MEKNKVEKNTGKKVSKEKTPKTYKAPSTAYGTMHIDPDEPKKSYKRDEV